MKRGVEKKLKVYRKVLKGVERELADFRDKKEGFEKERETYICNLKKEIARLEFSQACLKREMQVISRYKE